MPIKLIETTFPIREISELAIPERSSYKPIYQISKWFARRSSSTFRAILLSSLLEPNEDLMKHFYSEHDFSNITVLDPFVGGGTTIIEGLRLGMNCVGIDLNPVAWFISKAEAELVDINNLEKIIDDCEDKISKKIKQLYVTNCPVCKQLADIIYVHWVSLVKCEVCESSVPLFRNYIVSLRGKKGTFLCPECEFVFNSHYQEKYDQICPKCSYTFNPLRGNRTGRSNCTCRKCGNQTNIVEYRKKTQEILPVKMYAIEGFCLSCANDEANKSPLKETNYKFIKGVSEDDFNRYSKAEIQWKNQKEKLMWPKESIPIGETTKTLRNHNYTYWEQMFNKRQLLSLSLILNYIDSILDQTIQEMFLAAFINLLNHNNVFTRYSPKGKKVEGIFARHDFHPLSTYAENNVWGTKYGRGTWIKCLNRLLKGKRYNISPYDSFHERSTNGRKRMKKVYSGKIQGSLISDDIRKFPSDEGNLLLLCQDSATIADLPIHVDLIISDPPYADNVNYSELSDFFFVWLRLILGNKYSFFSSEETPKGVEAIESKRRSLDYYSKLTEIFSVAKTKLNPNGLFIFTFHHSDKQTWFKLSDVISKAGFQVIKAHSIPSEARNVLNIQKKKAIAFDLIIVCRTKSSKESPSKSLKEFKNLIEIEYKRNLNIIHDAGIEVMGLDWLAIFFGVLLENLYKFSVISSSGKNLSLQDAFEACYDRIKKFT